MDDYELQQELEALAGNAYDPNNNHGNMTAEPISTTMSRWQRLFGLSADDAVDSIMDHRNDLARSRVSDDHWHTVEVEKEMLGYDREAYEYEIGLQKKKATLPDLVPTADEESDSAITYLVELTGPLDAVDKVRTAANMDGMPPLVSGTSTEDGRAVFLCCVDGKGKSAILHWASTAGGGFEPTTLVDPRSLR
ncbi:hypothetical protein AC578_8107 [Pseudocercospora eumusae]|uniref:Uncharacterized protein n=1 Tax=Pseudocercospora eumusae TaxID=321146 RepID=A0A139H0J8_9PEZI|nr:hypothetical protein AC578_8107 [Pseudocercospora eumusae]